MAHTTENSNLVWQKVAAASEALGLAPNLREDLKKLKEYLATVGGNPNLKFTPIDKTVNGSDGDDAATVISDTASVALVALVLKKGSGTTAGFAAISNHASAIQAAKTTVLNGAGVVAGKQFALIQPKGEVHATGITYSSVTAYDGTTRSVIADGYDGFALSMDAGL